jgi:hypothetical protein
MLDISLLKPESSFTSCNIVPGISDHNGVLLEVEWYEKCREPQVERSVPVYHKTDVSGLEAFLREKFELWAGNGSSVEEIWNSYKGIIFECIKIYVPKKTLRKNPDPECFNREVNRLKVKVRKAYNKRKFGQRYEADLNRLSKVLLVAKKKAQETFLRSVLQNEGRFWKEFYKYVKQHKGNRENIPMIKDENVKPITESLEKAKALNSYFASIFSYKRNNPQIQSTDVGKPFTVSIKSIRKRLAAIGRKKSVGPDSIQGEILKLGGEAVTPYLARLLDITMNNNSIPSDWKKSYSGPHLQRWRPIGSW